jgi:hypothetical protein
MKTQNRKPDRDLLFVIIFVTVAAAISLFVALYKGQLLNF